VALNDKKLEKALSDIAAFQQKHNIISAQQMGDAAQKRLDAAIDEHQQKKKQRQLYENMTKEEFATSLEEGAKKATAGSRSKEGPATSATDTTDLLGSVGDTRYSELLLTLKTKQADQRFRSATLKPRHPFMVRLSQEIAKYEQQRDFILEQVETRRLAQVAGLKKEEASYEPLIEEYRKQVNDLRGIQQEYEALKSEETRIKNTLDNLRKQVDAVNMTSVYEEQIDIVEKGVGLPTPVSPNRGRMLLMGLMVGLAAGIGLIYFLHRLDDRLELAEDIEAELEEPILGQIPQMDLKSVSNGGILVTQLDPHSMYSESLRGVRSALMFGSLQQSKRIMIVTSAVPGDGKTTFAVNFALTLANAGNRVLLVDADLRRGSTHTFFNHQREPGLTEALEEELDWRDVVRSFDTNKQPLGIIHSGRLPDNPGELLISPACKRLIEEVRNEYDNVIFDSPPLTSIDDTFSLVSLANGVVFVVKAGQTSMRFAKNALAAVRQRGANVFGSVVNGIGADSPYYYYANYYHAYYAKESKGAVAAPHAGGRKKRFEKPAQAVASGSIQAAAQSLAGQPSSKRQIAAQEQIKVAQFKSRRSAQTAMLARQELSPQEKTDAAIAPVAGPKGHEQS
jgi:tyrosine-protein kinase Etk/Wzc